MFARLLLSLVCFGFLFLTASATPPESPVTRLAFPGGRDVKPGVTCDLRGWLKQVAEPARPEEEKAPRFHDEIEADGQRFVLDLGGSRAAADRLAEHLVIVRGTLVGNRVSVSELREPGDGFQTQYALVTVEGQLERDVTILCDRGRKHTEEGSGGLPAQTIFFWSVRVGPNAYALTLPSKEDEQTASKWIGQRVVLQGKLVGGRIEVTRMTLAPVR